MHERYADLAARITAWAAAEPDIHGLIVIGSQARTNPPADRWSDLDLMVFADTPDRWLGHEPASTNGWLERFGLPLAVFSEVTPLGFTDWDWKVRRALYADGRDVDFSILRMDRMDEVLAVNAEILAHGSRVLFDDTRTLSSRVAAAVEAWAADHAVAPEHPGGVTDATLQEAVQILLYHAVWALKKLKRGEVWIGAGCLNGFLRPHLLALIEAYNAAAGPYPGPLTYEGRFLERRTPLHVIVSLRACGTPYDPIEAIPALRALLDVIAELAPVAYAARSLAWDAEAVEGIRGLFDALVAGE